jgi:hypothetical protein
LFQRNLALGRLKTAVFDWNSNLLAAEKLMLSHLLKVATIAFMIVQILFSGFTQHRGYEHGWYKLREQLLDEGFSNGIHRRVWLEPWRANTRNLAVSLQILRQRYGTLYLGIYGYSYGGGFGAMQLIRRLLPSGIMVDKLVLADPVFRNPWLPVPLPSPLSLLPFRQQPRIHLPGNIVDLVHFYQTINLPQSPYLESDQLHGCVEHRQLQVAHQSVDDHEVVHRSVMRCAYELLEMSEKNQSGNTDIPFSRKNAA